MQRLRRCSPVVLRRRAVAPALIAIFCAMADGSALATDHAASAGHLIAVDVGHSAARPGAISASGIPEFVYNRELAGVIAHALQRRGLRTLLIGVDGEADALAGRTAAAADEDAGFFLSVHHDSVQPTYLQPWSVDGRILRHAEGFSGFSLFVSRRNVDPNRSLACARLIGAALRDRGFHPSLHHAEPIAGENRPLADAANGVYWFDDLVVLRTARSPAVLLEAGIIVNRAEEAALGQPATRQQIAAGVAAAVPRCLMGS